MYAVIRSGGKQERVAEGQRVRVELLAFGDPLLLSSGLDDGVHREESL